jgi:hypothetical protein
LWCLHNTRLDLSIHDNLHLLELRVTGSRERYRQVIRSLSA